MTQSHPAPLSPSVPTWDIAFTRLAHATRPRVEACARDLVHRFEAIGLTTDVEVRQTPRGLSTFIAVVGDRGLICIVDLTLIDGMAVHTGPIATLDVRLIDACGDIAADGLAGHRNPQALPAVLGDTVLQTEPLDEASATVYLAALAHFDLFPPATGHA